MFLIAYLGFWTYRGKQQIHSNAPISNNIFILIFKPGYVAKHVTTLVFGD